jgi:endonuclease/exonuclease/phosphatase family metal-dependent hydrolase
MLGQLQADLVGLQEPLSFQLDDLSQSFPELRTIGVGRDDGIRSGEHVPILFDPLKLRLIEAGHFWFSDWPEIPGSSSWGNINVRMCTWAQFEGVDGAARLRHFNVHLDHESQESRERSIDLLLQRIGSDPTDPVIVTGDFNSDEDNPALLRMRSAGFRDSFRVCHPNEKRVGTYGGFSNEFEPAKIDYILVNESIQVIDAQIEFTKVDGCWPSDHVPVTATLVIGG